jgi:hypothetical protein
LHCFRDKIRIYFMSFIVQISPFVHLFTITLVFVDLLGALSGHQSPRRKLYLHFILYLATPLASTKQTLSNIAISSNVTCSGHDVAEKLLILR